MQARPRLLGDRGAPRTSRSPFDEQAVLALVWAQGEGSLEIGKCLGKILLEHLASAPVKGAFCREATVVIVFGFSCLGFDTKFRGATLSVLEQAFERDASAFARRRCGHLDRRHETGRWPRNAIRQQIIG